MKALCFLIPTLALTFMNCEKSNCIKPTDLTGFSGRWKVEQHTDTYTNGVLSSSTLDTVWMEMRADGTGDFYLDEFSYFAPIRYTYFEELEKFSFTFVFELPEEIRTLTETFNQVYMDSDNIRWERKNQSELSGVVLESEIVWKLNREN